MCIITNIGYDHQNILGNTLQEIATQKAGIIKENVPVVIGETIPETNDIFITTALEKSASIIFAEENYTTIQTSIIENRLICEVKNINTNNVTSFTLDLSGLYQAKNICTVLTAIGKIRNIGFAISETALQQGLQTVKESTGLRGRWDVIQQNPLVINDVAHNKDGISQVLHQLKTNFPTSNLHFVLGFVNDKDVDSVLQLFPTNAQYYFTNAHIPRAMPYVVLQEKAAEKNLVGQGFDNVNDALLAAKNNALENDVIMVCGSFFVIAELH